MNTNSTTTADRSAPKRRKALVLSATLSLALVAALAAYAMTHSTAGGAPPPAAAPSGPRVTVATVEEQSIADYDEITGHVDATETVELRARVSGHLDSVHFQAGQVVKEGDVLF